MKKAILLMVAFLLVAIQAWCDTYRRVSVHDPSIVIGYKKDGKVTGVKSEGAIRMNYIFGSHKAFAKSGDMKNWTTFSNNIQSQQSSLFAKEIEWSALGSENGYDVNGNLWAPDVIWNKDMGKWCMYMSVNGDYWYSSIVLLTSDSPEGNWTYVGPVIYSIPWKASAENIAKHTDFYEVTGESAGTVPSRYKINSNGNQTYGTNAIDPCVFYDEDGKLWMSYGSWFGGLWMIELDRQTGLRDKTHSYELVGGSAANAESDPYQGIKIYGGNGMSGEASYIEYINDRYYLFVTYGGLTAAGGYNMRVFSSASPTGPYRDMQGNDARVRLGSSLWSDSCPGTVNGHVGTRLMSYYKWDWLDFAQCAQGHNSVVVDGDGKVFNVYHTRFNTGNEWHSVRVHQMFQASNGGLCTAPFEYCGETLSETGFTTEEVAGFYGIIDHGWGTDFANLGYVSQTEIELTADGKVRGAFTGSWTLHSVEVKGGQSSVGITINRGADSFEGVLIKQKAEERNDEVLCFTSVCKDRSLWGFKKYGQGVNFKSDDLDANLPFPRTAIKATYNDVNTFHNATPVADISGETGLSLSFYLSTPIASDWDKVAHSTIGDYILYLGVLHYASSDWYESAATPASGSGYDAGNQWQAFLNQACLVTISYNVDGTIAYYKNGQLLYTYQADTAPGWSGANSDLPTPKDAAKAVVEYYKNKQLVFDLDVSHITVAHSVQSIAASIKNIEFKVPVSKATFNLQGQRVGNDYRGIVIKNGKKILK